MTFTENPERLFESMSLRDFRQQGAEWYPRLAAPQVDAQPAVGNDDRTSRNTK
jgi:hypothetical protein